MYESISLLIVYAPRKVIITKSITLVITKSMTWCHIVHHSHGTIHWILQFFMSYYHYILGFGRLGIGPLWPVIIKIKLYVKFYEHVAVKKLVFIRADICGIRYRVTSSAAPDIWYFKRQYSLLRMPCDCFNTICSVFQYVSIEVIKWYHAFTATYYSFLNWLRPSYAYMRQ